ncbi:MAG: hypothetical protein II387_07905 [Oscillospiraceae bacterium]|nr:hypothetical protein [Oscillospiraceae bacterium]
MMKSFRQLMRTPLRALLSALLIAALLAAMALMLCGCGAGAEEKETPVIPDQPEISEPVESVAAEYSVDYDNRWFYRGGFIETEHAYVEVTTNHEYLKYYAKDSGDSGILCGKPECDHKGTDCNGYLGTYDNSLSWYGGKLYWVYTDINEGRGKVLCRANEDGSGREVVRELSGELEIFATSFFLHRGRIISVQEYPQVNKAVPSTKLEICSAPIEGSESFKLIFREEFPESMSQYCNIYGDFIYVFIYTEDQFEYYKINITDGTVDLSYEQENPGIERAAGNGAYITEDGTVYYAAPNGFYRITEAGAEMIPYENPDTPAGRSVLAGAVVTGQPYETYSRYVWLSDFEGKSLYEGELPCEALKGIGEPNEVQYLTYFMGGDQNGVVFRLSNEFGKYELLVKYEIAEDGLVEIPLIYDELKKTKPALQAGR